nr:MAG TPA: hypothetical protein [Caudoviricetes sp.]
MSTGMVSSSSKLTPSASQIMSNSSTLKAGWPASRRDSLLTSHPSFAASHRRLFCAMKRRYRIPAVVSFCVLLMSINLAYAKFLSRLDTPYRIC